MMTKALKLIKINQGKQVELVKKRAKDVTPRITSLKEQTIQVKYIYSTCYIQGDCLDELQIQWKILWKTQNEEVLQLRKNRERNGGKLGEVVETTENNFKQEVLPTPSKAEDRLGKVRTEKN